MPSLWSLAIFLLVVAGPTWAFELGPPIPSGMADLETGKGFFPLPADTRVRYEAGARQFAVRTAALIPAAAERVAEAHGRAFLRNVTIFVFATDRSFARLSASARALTRDGHVYLSPNLFDKPDRVAGILTHELSHAHLMQYLESDGNDPPIPAWFREGLAVWVAGGGGAEGVSPADAIRAIRNGHWLRAHSQANEKRASGEKRLGLSPQMFYRQSGMFIGYLRSRDPHRFNLFIAALLDRVPFERAFRAAYHGPADMVWQQFAARLRSRAD